MTGGFTTNLDLYRKTNHGLEGAVEQTEVFFFHDLLHKFSFNEQHGSISVKAYRLQAFDPDLIGNLRQFMRVNHILSCVFLDHLK